MCEFFEGCGFVVKRKSHPPAETKGLLSVASWVTSFDQMKYREELWFAIVGEVKFFIHHRFNCFG